MKLGGGGPTDCPPLRCCGGQGNAEAILLGWQEGNTKGLFLCRRMFSGRRAGSPGTPGVNYPVQLHIMGEPVVQG